jgi:hypothetical protein
MKRERTRQEMCKERVRENETGGICEEGGADLRRSGPSPKYIFVKYFS